MEARQPKTLFLFILPYNKYCCPSGHSCLFSAWKYKTKKKKKCPKEASSPYPVEFYTCLLPKEMTSPCRLATATPRTCFVIGITFSFTWVDSYTSEGHVLSTKLDLLCCLHELFSFSTLLCDVQRHNILVMNNTEQSRFPPDFPMLTSS